MMNFFRIIRNNVGMGLLEIMVAVGLTGALSLTIAKMMQNSQEDAKVVEAKSSNNTFSGQLQGYLGNAQACQNTFGTLVTAANMATLATATNTVNVPAIRNKNTTIVFDLNSKSMLPLTITSMVLTNYNATDKTIDFKVFTSFRKKSTMVLSAKPITIPMNFDVTGTTLNFCMALSGASNVGQWQDMSSPALGIFYNMGSVLIGTGTVNTTSVTPAFGMGTANTVSGANAAAFGSTNSVTGAPAFAFGGSNAISGPWASAVGLQNFVSGRYGQAVGFQNSVTGEAGVAFGKGNIASGINSHAVGDTNLASGLSSTALGYYNLASGAYGLASGYFSTASGSSSTAIGNSSTASGASSFAAASGNASGVNSMAFGSGSEAAYQGSTAFLGDSKAKYAVAFGLTAGAYGQYSVALGRGAKTGAAGTPDSSVSGFFSTAIGPFALSTGNYGLALGAGTAGVSATASGANSVAIGNGSIASSGQAVAMGYSVTASGNRSVALGGQVLSSGSGALSFGLNIKNTHTSSTILGQNPWGTIFSRAVNLTTVYGPGIDLCTATASGGTSPYWGDTCEVSSAVNITRTNNLPIGSPNYARVGIGVRNTAYALEVNCTGNPAFCAYKSDTTATWHNASDRRLKNIEKDYKRGLKEILKINPVYYRYKDNKDLGLSSEQLGIGIIAQDVQPYFPEAVNKMANGYLGFHLDPVIWGSVNAIKEQNSEIVKLKQENKDLKEALCELHPEIKLCKNK
jgi:type II secretory pathway pseudopilin PulG